MSFEENPHLANDLVGIQRADGPAPTDANGETLTISGVNLVLVLA